MTGIIDYGAGNLKSVKNALQYLSEDCVVSGDVKVLSECDRLILPGVGAFPEAMNKLKASGLDSFIKDYVKKKPLLGICLGMQLLFDRSFEFSECEGLGLIRGEVVKIPDMGLKIPHMGWNELSIVNGNAVFKDVKDGDFVYFVHSYYARAASRSDVTAVTDYGCELTAAVANGNVYGAQFHPEKSDRPGLSILKNFCGL